jgi:hypothetical protein
MKTVNVNVNGKVEEIYNYNPDSAIKAILVIISPIIAPFVLFSKFMYNIKNIKIVITYE